MLFVVLIASLLHLGWMNYLLWQRQNTITCLLAGAAPLVLVGGVIASLPLVVQAVVLGVLAAACCHSAPRKPLVFFVCSTPTVTLLWIITIVGAAWFERNQTAKFPLESMAKRVPAPKPANHHNLAEKGLSDLEDRLEAVDQEHPAWSRTGMLRRLHENTTERFIFSQGFGVMRMPYLTPERINRATEELKPVAQPGVFMPYAISADDLERPVSPSDDLRRLHIRGIADFVNQKGFGYIKDRDHVAGFLPHQFSAEPGPDVRRLELVSVLMHAKPVVYVSNELPRMGELKHTHTRGLNEFEATGLAALEQGEDLFVRRTPEALLMMGAIRSVKQCIQCHDGERGDLLGAFSYRLR